MGTLAIDAAGSGLAYRLSFLLPDHISFAVPAGRHSPCLHGCVLTVGRAGLVTIEGPSRERAFDQARRFLRVVAKGRGALQLAAVLVSPGGGGRDSWTIIVGADIAFAPTGLGADIAAA